MLPEDLTAQPEKHSTEVNSFWTLSTPFASGEVRRRQGKPFSADAITAAEFQIRPRGWVDTLIQLGTVADGATMIVSQESWPAEVLEATQFRANGKTYYAPDVFWTTGWQAMIAGLTGTEPVGIFPEEFTTHPAIVLARLLGRGILQDLQLSLAPLEKDYSNLHAHTARLLFEALNDRMGQFLHQAFPNFSPKNREQYPSGIAAVLVRSKQMIIGATHGFATAGDISICQLSRWGNSTLLNDPSIVDEADRRRREVFDPGDIVSQCLAARYRVEEIGNLQGFPVNKMNGQVIASALLAFTDGFRIPQEETSMADTIMADPTTAVDKVNVFRTTNGKRGDDGAFLMMGEENLQLEPV